MANKKTIWNKKVIINKEVDLTSDDGSIIIDQTSSRDYDISVNPDIISGGGSGDVTKSYVDTQDTNLQTQIDNKVDNITSSDSSVEVTRSGNDVDLKVLSSGGSQDLQSVLDTGNEASGEIIIKDSYDENKNLTLNNYNISFNSEDLISTLRAMSLNFNGKVNVGLNNRLEPGLNDNAIAYLDDDINELENFDELDNTIITTKLLEKYNELNPVESQIPTLQEVLDTGNSSTSGMFLNNFDGETFYSMNIDSKRIQGNKFNLNSYNTLVNCTIQHDISELNTLEDFNNTSKIQTQCIVTLDMLKKLLALTPKAPIKTTYGFGSDKVILSGVDTTPIEIPIESTLSVDDSILFDNDTKEITYTGESDRLLSVDFVSSVRMTAGANANIKIQLYKRTTQGDIFVAESTPISVPNTNTYVPINATDLEIGTISKNDVMIFKVVSDIDTVAQSYEFLESTRLQLMLTKNEEV